MKPQLQKWIQASLSIWLVFHLFVVLISPNPDSLVFRIVAPVTQFYGNFFGVNNTWRFFSPNPLMRILEYEARTYDESGDVLREEVHRFPESYEAVGTREGYNRRLNFAMMTSSRTEVLEQILSPLLCRLQPWAQEIAIYQIQRDMPSIEKAQVMGSDRESLANVQRLLIKDIQCLKDET